MNSIDTHIDITFVPTLHTLSYSHHHACLYPSSHRCLQRSSMCHGKRHCQRPHRPQHRFVPSPLCTPPQTSSNNDPQGNAVYSAEFLLSNSTANVTCTGNADTLKAGGFDSIFVCGGLYSIYIEEIKLDSYNLTVYKPVEEL